MSVWPYNTERWKALRAEKLKRTPLCEYCPPDRRRPATCVDHSEHIRFKGDERAWDVMKLRSSCWPCHGAKTARGPEAGAAQTTKPMKGCDVDGLPLDPSHPFRARP